MFDCRAAGVFNDLCRASDLRSSAVFPVAPTFMATHVSNPMGRGVRGLPTGAVLPKFALHPHSINKPSRSFCKSHIALRKRAVKKKSAGESIRTTGE